jgi:hypothetical protein
MTYRLVNHHTTSHLVFVLVSTDSIMMYPTNDNPASYEILAVARFLQAKT